MSVQPPLINSSPQARHQIIHIGIYIDDPKNILMGFLKTFDKHGLKEGTIWYEVRTIAATSIEAIQNRR